MQKIKQTNLELFSRTKLERIAKHFGTPAYVYSESLLHAQLRQLITGLTGMNYQICYAVKSCSNLSILRSLQQGGAGFDLVSLGELKRALRAGAKPKTLVFSGVGKKAEEMQAALALGSSGILSFNVESEGELLALDRIARKLGQPARACLRFNPNIDARTHPYISTGLKESKFGLEKNEILRIFKSAHKFRGIKLTGLSVHIGSQILNMTPLESAFKEARSLFKKLESIAMEPLTVLDIGGGLGVSYQDENAPSIEDYCAVVRRCFGPKSGFDNRILIVLEPGRVLSASAGILLSRVLYVKNRGLHRFLVVDAAMNDLLRPALYGSYHEIRPIRPMSGKLVKTEVVGPVCESTDFFAKGRLLPRALKPGDLIAVQNTGAYSFSMSSQYNSRPRAPEVLITMQNKLKLIRKRESINSLMQGE